MIPYAILELFPDAYTASVDGLPVGGFLASCPLCGPSQTIVFDEQCYFLGCTSGACSRGDVYGAAMAQAVRAA